MSKKAKKPAKVMKKAKPASKPAKKAVKPAKKIVKPVVKVVKKLAKPKAMPAKMAKPLKKENSIKDVKQAKNLKASVKEEKGVAKAPEKSADKSPSPKTLQTKGAATEISKVEVKTVIKDIVLTDAEGRILCRVKDCDQPSVVEGYCRYHYLFFWKKIQNRKKILSEGKLEQYIEELTSRYPLKFLELIRKDLGSEPDFMSAIQELDIDEASNVDEFEDENFMEEVRGIGSGDTERVDDEY